MHCVGLQRRSNDHGRPVGEGPGGQVPLPQLMLVKFVLMVQYICNTGYGIICKFWRLNYIIFPRVMDINGSSRLSIFVRVRGGKVG